MLYILKGNTPFPFPPFLNTLTNIAQNLTINGISISGELGIQTRDRRMEGSNESTDLWRPPYTGCFTTNVRNKIQT